MCQRSNDCHQIPEDGVEPDDRRSGGGSEGQGGGTRRVRVLTSIFTCNLITSKRFLFLSRLQELERLKAEVESANEFQSQRDSLSLKLQVSAAH